MLYRWRMPYIVVSEVAVYIDSVRCFKRKHFVTMISRCCSVCSCLVGRRALGSSIFPWLGLSSQFHQGLCKASYVHRKLINQSVGIYVVPLKDLCSKGYPSTG